MSRSQISTLLYLLLLFCTITYTIDTAIYVHTSVLLLRHTEGGDLSVKHREGVRSALFWDVTELEWLIPYRRFGTKCRSIIQVSLPLKKGPISSPEA
jgi:hypothetical protein